MKPRPDLLSAHSPEGLEVWQLTNEILPACHVYMEAQVFTPDSTRFLLHRGAHPHGSDPENPEHRYLLCEVESGALTPVTDELGATGPAVSPDGRYFYYFVAQPSDGGRGLGQRILLKRRNLEGGEPTVLSVLDGEIPGTRFRPSRLYPLSTLSADGTRIAISCFLGDGDHAGAPWGLLVFDLSNGDCWVPLHGPAWINMHPQYCRSDHPEYRNDLMVQENHGARMKADGTKEAGAGGLGADIHLIRDDGQNFRNFPWGRDIREYCQGHQCWRGNSLTAISGTNSYPNGNSQDPSDLEGELIEASPGWFQDHNGLAGEGSRNRLCRQLPPSYFCHFATDRAGDLLITDTMENVGGFLSVADESVAAVDALYIMRMGQTLEDPFLRNQFILRPRASWQKGAHVHPFLSPDGKTAFFNSDESGILQAYMIRNLPVL